MTTQQILNTLSSLQNELNQADWLETEPLREQLRQVMSLIGDLTTGTQEEAEPKKLEKIANAIRKTTSLDSLLNTTVLELKKALDVSRALVYRFNDSKSGVVVAEALIRGYTPMMGKTIPVEGFGLEISHLSESLQYQQQIGNVAQANLTPYQIQLMERYQVTASACVPVLSDDKVWGLLVVQQCTGDGNWSSGDIALLNSVAQELTFQVQINEIRQQCSTEIENTNQELGQLLKLDREIIKIIGKLSRNKTSIKDFFNYITRMVRDLLKCDRVCVYQFLPDWSGVYIAESVGNEWIKLVDGNVKTVWEDTHLKDTQGGRYAKGETFVVNNIYEMGHSQCHVDILEQFQIKSYVLTPIFSGNKLWGIFCAYQNRDFRQWQNYEVDLLTQLGVQLGIGVGQVEASENLEKTSIADQTLVSINDKIRQERDLDTMFSTIVSETRNLFKCDRATIIKFNFDGDWNQECLAESVGREWMAWNSPNNNKLFHDDHIHKVREKLYRPGQPIVAHNIYAPDYPECYVEVLEAGQVKAYINAAIYVHGKLWGWLGIFQNDDIRTWQDYEVSIADKLARQVGLGIEQVQYFEELEAKNQSLAQAAVRGKALARAIDKIREAKDIDSIFRNILPNIRGVLNCDRATIIKFNFDGDWNQECLAESVGQEWMPWNSPNKNKLFHDDHIQEVREKLYRQGQPIVADDIYIPDYPECYVEVLEQGQVKAYINAAIYVKGKLWGWLGIFQNDNVRHWQDYEVSIADKLARQIGLGIEQVQYFEELEAKNQSLAEAAAQEKALAETIDKIRQAKDIDAVFRNVLSNIRGVLNCDRIAVYKFLPDWGGVFTAESVVSNEWEPWVGVDIKTVWKDTYLQETKGGRYAKGETFVVNNAYEMGHSQCHVDILAQFRIKSYILAPIFVDRQLWGIICAYEHGEFRTWKQNEVNLVSQLGSQLGIGIQQSKYIKQLVQTSNADQTLAIISDKIRQARKLDAIFDSIVFDARSLLKCDRATIIKFNFEGDWNQECLAESVGQEWMPWNSSSSHKVFHDDHIQKVREQLYRQGQPIVADDIYLPDYPECYVEVLEQGQVKAYINASIYVNGKLWGWLGIFQNDDVRTWENYEVSIADKLARQIGLAIEQVQYFEELEAKNKSLAQAAAQEKALARAIDKVRQAQDLDSIFRNTLPDIRGILKCDRLAIYQFLPDWSGEFIAESVGSDWVPLVGKGIRTVWEDTYLQETQGGRYKEGETLVVDDVYTIGFSQCHLDLLEQFQMKAHVLAPIFVGKKLWGILGAYQNSGARHWQTNEVDLINRLASQLGLGVQQAEFLTQVQEQEKQLQAAAEREKTAREQLQMEALQMLRALQPSFQGDLTVRAPLSESELGTIADGYNTTMSNLRGLVKQVKATAIKVGETSEQNSFSVNQLSTQAQQQVSQMNNALQQLRTMVQSTEAVAVNAQKVEQAVQEANKTVKAGDSLMEKTVDEMLEIRETVSQTAKKIKRLGEASQKISKVVNLIENFATQTNLLALNAAIEATRAGEYGKGFAVVADEVRSLAYQSANATTEIERFVQDIQKEINEVTEAMEIGISQVVKGSDLVDETRNSLSAIVSATDEISELVAGITHTTTSQSQQSEILTTAMTEVSQVAQKTSESSTQISESFRRLLTTSQDLQTSVSRFKVD